MSQLIKHICIRTTANEIIPLDAGLRARSSMPSITENERWHAQGNYGNIVIEEINVGHYTIRLFTIRTLKKLSLTISTSVPVICARIAMTGDWRFSLGRVYHNKICKGHYAMYRLNGFQEKIFLEKGEHYRIFDVIIPESKFEVVTQILPGIEAYIDTSKAKSKVYLTKPKRTTTEMLDVVRGIQNCPYVDALRKYYLNNNLDLLIILMLTTASKDTSDEDEPTEAEIKAVQAAEKMILTDIAIHHSIPAIARKVKLNEYRLKYVFKCVYKTGLFEYLFQARMELAKHMLVETDLSIKEITERIGYRVKSGFMVAFKKQFGCTPGSFRRNLLSLKVVD